LHPSQSLSIQFKYNVVTDRLVKTWN
jgi:hypothetical protein